MVPRIWTLPRRTTCEMCLNPGLGLDSTAVVLLCWANKLHIPNLMLLHPHVMWSADPWYGKQECVLPCVRVRR